MEVSVRLEVCGAFRVNGASHLCEVASSPKRKF